MPKIDGSSVRSRYLKERRKGRGSRKLKRKQRKGTKSGHHGHKGGCPVNRKAEKKRVGGKEALEVGVGGGVCQSFQDVCTYHCLGRGQGRAGKIQTGGKQDCKKRGPDNKKAVKRYRLEAREEKFRRISSSHTEDREQTAKERNRS